MPCTRWTKASLHSLRQEPRDLPRLLGADLARLITLLGMFIHFSFHELPHE